MDSQTTEAFFTQRHRVAAEDVWHQRLAHTNSKIVKHLQNQKLIYCNATTQTICRSCQIAKSAALPFPLSDTTSNVPLEKIHCDIWGPSPVSSFQKFKYYVIFVDNFSRYSWLYPMKLKSEFYDIFVEFQKLVERQFNHRIKIFHCDGGGEFISNRFQNHLRNSGIKQFMSCPHTPEQNGISERKHRHIVELGLAMLYHSRVPLKFWVDAFMTANYIVNILPTPKLQLDSPYSKIHHHQPSYEHLRVFGCACYPCLRPYTQHKFDPRSLTCVFLGYSERHKGYRCLVPTDGRIYISRHVVFDENFFPFTKKLTTDYEHYTTLYKQWVEEVKLLDSHSAAPVNNGFTDHPANFRYSPTLEDDHTDTSYIVSTPQISSFTHMQSDSVAEEQPGLTSTSVTPTDIVIDQGTVAVHQDTAAVHQGTAAIHHMQTRLKSGIIKPNPKYACLAEYKVPLEPRSVKSALADEGWYRAMQEEMNALYENQTWILVPRTNQMNVIGCKWVFKTKLAPDGSLDRLKARLVAKGFHQEEGVDFTETFSPVVKHATIRIVLSVAMMKNWPIHQLDVKNAFLHGVLNETMYMEQPPGFIHPQKSQCVCLLKRSLYGLRQAPRAWFDKFSNFLLENGFFCSTADPSLFVLHSGSDIVLLLLYVDDIILIGSSAQLLATLIKKLSLQFHMKDLGYLHYFLGIEAKRTSQDLFLCQTKYAIDLLNRAHMTECKPVSTPLPLRSIAMTNDDILLADPLEYRSIVGGLQYLTITRPDLAYATNLLCQKLQHPTIADFHKLKRVLRYVKGTAHLGIFLHSNSSTALYGYSDADWAGCADTRRSTTGFCTYLGSNLLSWSAKKQPTVSHSSTEAEYRALASTTADLTWISFVLRDIGISLISPTLLFCDNKSAISLTANPILHARTKHIEVDFHFVREKVSSGSINVRYIPTHLQLADIFTKSLSRFAHSTIRTKLGMRFLTLPNLRGDVKEIRATQPMQRDYSAVTTSTKEDNESERAAAIVKINGSIAQSIKRSTQVRGDYLTGKATS